jgi:hypothetical protein|tara:strand:- start:641 stop:838 length:198 start_codon:yes stop_codon:yes gene_type:complete
MDKILSREELQRLINVLSGITQRTAADIANLNDRVVTLNQVMGELNTLLNPNEDSEPEDSTTSDE